MIMLELGTLKVTLTLCNLTISYLKVICRIFLDSHIFYGEQPEHKCCTSYYVLMHINMHYFQVRVETYTGTAADKTNKTVTTTFNLPLSTTVRDIRCMRIWKKKDGSMTSLPSDAFTLSYMGKEIADETTLAEVAMPGQPITFKVFTVCVPVVYMPEWGKKDYTCFVNLHPSADCIAAFKGQVYGFDGVNQEHQHFVNCTQSHLGFDSTKVLNSIEVEDARRFLKDCAVFPGDVMRLTEL